MKGLRGPSFSKVQHEGIKQRFGREKGTQKEFKKTKESTCAEEMRGFRLGRLFISELLFISSGTGYLMTVICISFSRSVYFIAT